MKTKLFTTLLGTGFMALAGLANADSGDNVAREYRVTLWNDSGLAIEQFFMSPTSDPSWRRDRLGDTDLPSGYHTTIYTGPGNYDVKLVDQDGDQCIVNGIHIGGDRRLTLTPATLLHCEQYL